MLPPFIIEQIRRRESQEKARREAERPRVEIPVDVFPPGFEHPVEKPEQHERGVTILEL